MSECGRCGGTGFEIVAKDGREFARPCECRRLARRSGGSFLEDCRVPARYEECSFATFRSEDPALVSVLQTCMQYCAGFPFAGTAEEGIGLVFTGNAGVGKTFFAVAVLRQLYERHGARGQFWDFHDLMREIRRSYDPETRTSEYGVLQPVIDAAVLLLDDLGAWRITDWMNDTLFHIVNSRFVDKRPTLITTNYIDRDPDELRKDREAEIRYIQQSGSDKPGRPYIDFTEYLADRIGVRLRSRLLQMCHIIRVVGVDQREWYQRTTLSAIRQGGRVVTAEPAEEAGSKAGRDGS